MVSMLRGGLKDVHKTNLTFKDLVSKKFPSSEPEFNRRRLELFSIFRFGDVFLVCCVSLSFYINIYIYIYIYPM